MKAANCGVRIEARGKRLALVATFPPKPHTDHKEWKQSKLALGIYANGAGIQSAEKEARKVGGLLATKESGKLEDLVFDSHFPSVRPIDR